MSSAGGGKMVLRYEEKDAESVYFSITTIFKIVKNLEMYKSKEHK